MMVIDEQELNMNDEQAQEQILLAVVELP